MMLLGENDNSTEGKGICGKKEEIKNIGLSKQG
jgi:hypothetical protein